MNVKDQNSSKFIIISNFYKNSRKPWGIESMHIASPLKSI